MTATNTRKQAREALAGKWSKGLLITLIFVLISFGLSYLSEAVEKNDFLSFIILIITIAYNISITLGIAVAFIKLKREPKENVKPYEFLKNFFPNLKRSFFIGIRVLLKMIVPIFILFIAMFILSYLITVAPSNATSSSTLLILFIILYIIGICYIVVKSLLYSLVYYISIDNPDMSAKDVVEESAKLMKGNRGNLFVLNLSFIGWAILSLLTLGIGYLWLIPYTQIATVCFYEELINKNSTDSNTVIDSQKK